MKRKIILDCDPGHDDAMAILLAGAQEELEILGITTVAGNSPVENTTRNALIITQIANLDVPVYKGMDRPMVREPYFAGGEVVHGKSGLEGPVLPPLEREAEKEHAVDFIIETVKANRWEITLVPTGPLTNIGMAFRKAPEIIPWVREISLMGGAINEGNVTPSAEFNIFFDPEAADIVFSSGIPIFIAPLELTHQAIIGPKELDKIRAIDSYISKFTVDLLEFYSRFHKRRYRMEGAPLHDPCAVLYLIRPDLIEMKKFFVQIETKGELTAGRTVCDIWGVTEKEPNINVGVKLNHTGFVDELIKALKAYR